MSGSFKGDWGFPQPTEMDQNLPKLICIWQQAIGEKVDKFVKILRQKVIIRGCVTKPPHWLKLAFLFGTEPMSVDPFSRVSFFYVRCILDYDNKRKTFWGEPQISTMSAKTAEEIEGYAVRELGPLSLSLGTKKCLVYRYPHTDLLEVTKCHPQLLQTLTYLCAELRNKAYNIASGREDGGILDKDIFTILANRLEGYVQSVNREYLKLIGIPEMK